MSRRLLDRVEVVDGSARLRGAGGPVSSLLASLEAGAEPAKVVATLSLEPEDLIAALVFDQLGQGDGPSLVLTVPSRPKLEDALSEPMLAGVFSHMPRINRLALSAGLLQIHDFWDASHKAAQEADDLGEKSVSPYWHGIAHRREPDPGNAKYWFRRVGEHPVFSLMAEQADLSLLGSLVEGGEFKPLAFVDVCTNGRGETATLARRVQQREMLLLLEASLPG